jgi:hypothetical protein
MFYVAARSPPPIWLGCQQSPPHTWFSLQSWSSLCFGLDEQRVCTCSMGCMNDSTVSYCLTRLAAVKAQPPFCSIWLPAVTIQSESAASSPAPPTSIRLPAVSPVCLTCYKSPSCLAQLAAVSLLFNSAASNLTPVQLSWQQSPSGSTWLPVISLLFSSAASSLPPVQLSCQ